MGLRILNYFLLLLFGLKIFHTAVLMNRSMDLENDMLSDNREFKCQSGDSNSNSTDFYTIKFHRSPYNCRVYHICAFGKQFSYICAEGLFFDERLDTCNFEHEVDCEELSAPVSLKNEISSPKPTGSNELNNTNKHHHDDSPKLAQISLATSSRPTSDLNPTTVPFQYTTATTFTTIRYNWKKLI